jgi:flagellar hook protein FlgE
MALTSTLYTGLSGLNVNQTRLNVVGNNIANVNTVAFKKSRALFAPQFYVTDEAGGPPSSNFGGANPSQRGLGASVAAIEKDFSAGSIETTGKSTDLAVDGDGFFIVKGTSQRYTRDGSFNLNSTNDLVTTGGEFVQGFGVDAEGNVIPGTLNNINIPLGSQTQAKATTKVEFEGNLNANGTIATGAGVITSQAFTTAGGTLPDDNSLLVDLRDPADLTTPLFAAGDLSLNGKKGGRDLPDVKFTIDGTTTLGQLRSFYDQSLGLDTTARPGFPTAGAQLGSNTGDAANVSRLFVVSNVGKDNAVALNGSAFSNTAGTNGFTFNPATAANSLGTVDDQTGESINTSFPVYDSLGTPLNVSVTAVLESKSDAGTTWRFWANSPDDTRSVDTFDPTAPTTGTLLGSGTLQFDPSGKLQTVASNTLTVRRDNTGAATPLNINLDLNSLTSLTDSKSLLAMNNQDGYEIGTLNDFSIGTNGIITGKFSNGLTQTLGQVAMATFDNPAGLIDEGGNKYSAGANSGVAVVVAPQQLGAGSIRSGALEMSNVDLSEEFINLIVSSTGFSASSRVISTSDQLINELLQTSR